MQRMLQTQMLGLGILDLLVFFEMYKDTYSSDKSFPYLNVGLLKLPDLILKADWSALPRPNLKMRIEI